MNTFNKRKKNHNTLSYKKLFNASIYENMSTQVGFLYAVFLMLMAIGRLEFFLET